MGTKAPWVDPSVEVEPCDHASTEVRPARPNRHTGQPVQPLIAAEPSLPSPSAWPDVWKPAKKCISSVDDVKKALRGGTLHSFVAFTLSLNDSVRGVKLSDACHVSPVSQAVLKALETLSTFCKDTPPVSHQVRYGNPAYRQWFQKLKAAAPEMLYNILGEESGEATLEILPYFLDSFGNSTRIDYGTGHETTFVSFLYCLYKLGVLGKQDQQATVTRVFSRYLFLLRELQTTYWLEPAGSHGVWGLDEYHFFPFVWGASQLCGHPELVPSSVTKDDVLEAYHNDYMYMDAVRFVRQVKKGPLHETSPLLYDITAVQNWDKVNRGLCKMYQVEVLSKAPIMQHSLWGSLMPFPG